MWCSEGEDAMIDGGARVREAEEAEEDDVGDLGAPALDRSGNGVVEASWCM